MLWVLIMRGDSNEYPQHMFLWRTDENEKSVNKQCLLDTPLPRTVPVWPWKWGQGH